MSTYTPGELVYLRSQKLGRLATVGPDGDPHVVPLTFEVADDGSVVLRGFNLTRSRKWRDLQAEPRTSIVVDDVLPPWEPRGIEVRGTATLVEGDDPQIRIRPTRVISWGIDTHPYTRSARSIP